MLRWLRQNSENKRIGHDLYAQIVAQARCPGLYGDGGAPDSLDGRLELIMLHLVLVLRRLRREGPATQRLGQIVMEAFVAELDDALRQIGVGDMGVPRRVQRAAAALSERATAYERELDAAPEASAGADPLAAALAANVWREPGEAGLELPAARRLAAYVRAVDAHLAALPQAALCDGRLSFPPVVDKEIAP
jgi:cytochrome b pre-mRNA-processing protein 3